MISLQYSDYDVAIAATPQRSTAPVISPPAAGEYKQAEIVVDVPLEDAAETTIDFGHAEPGLNIFAGVPHEDLKSSNVVVKQQPAEEKEISSVEVQQTSTAAQAFHGVAQPAAEDATAETTSEDSLTAVDLPTPEEEEPVKVQGALLEEEAEADRVRHELFSDAELD